MYVHQSPWRGSHTFALSSITISKDPALLKVLVSDFQQLWTCLALDYPCLWAESMDTLVAVWESGRQQQRFDALETFFVIPVEAPPTLLRKPN